MEEVLPPQTDSGSGFDLTRIPQFTVFLENRVGRLTMLLRALEPHIGGVIALAVEESADSALVRMVCRDCAAARDLLRSNGFSFSETEVLAVELPGETSTPLLLLCTALLGAEINIHYAYPLLVRRRTPALVLYVDDPTLAARVLFRKGFNILSENDLKDKPLD